MSPFDDLWRALSAVLELQGYPASDGPVSVAVKTRSGRRQRFAVPELEPLADDEKIVMDLFWGLSPPAPLRQTDIAKRAKLRLELVKKITPRLVEKGYLFKHPSLGFYVRGTRFDEPPKS